GIQKTVSGEMDDSVLCKIFAHSRSPVGIKSERNTLLAGIDRAGDCFRFICGREQARKINRRAPIFSLVESALGIVGIGIRRFGVLTIIDNRLKPRVGGYFQS